MDNLEMEGAVSKATGWTSHRAVHLAVRGAVDLAVSGAVNGVMYWDVHGAVEWVVDRAVDRAVYWVVVDVKDAYPDHPGLQDFLLVVREP